MRQVTVNIYEFDELPEETKEKAIAAIGCIMDCENKVDHSCCSPEFSIY